MRAPNRLFAPTSLLVLFAVHACGSVSVEREPEVAPSEPERPTVVEPELPPAMASVPDDQAAPAPEAVEEGPPGLFRFPDQSIRHVRLVAVRDDGGHWNALVLEGDDSEEHAVLASRRLEALATVDGRWDVPVSPRRVVAVDVRTDAPIVAYRAGLSGNTEILARAIGEGGVQSVLVPAFGPVELERGETLRAFDFVGGSPARALAGWIGVSRRPRPRREIEAAQRRYDEAIQRNPLQMRNPPDTHRTAARWRRVGVGSPRGLSEHTLLRQDAGAGGLDDTNRILGVVAGESRHAVVHAADRPDGRQGMRVTFFDAGTGRRVGRHDAMSGDPHGFGFRAGIFDREGRLWLIGAARQGDGGDAHWVYVFDSHHRVLSRRRLPHRGTWQGASGLVECGGATWVVAAAVDHSERRERLHVYPLGPQGDPPEPRVVFEADSPYGTGDSVWHTHDLHVGCSGQEVAAAFRFGPRHEPRADVPFGLARWASHDHRVQQSAATEQAAPPGAVPRACTAQPWGGWDGTAQCRRSAHRRIPAAHARCESDADCVDVGTGCHPHAVSARFERRYRGWPAPCTPPGAGGCSDPGAPRCEAGCCVVGSGLGQ